MVKQINELNFLNETKGEVILVDFYATWCPPCKMLAPVLEDLSNTRKYRIAKVNIDENNNLANELKIDVVPTLLVFKDGKIVDRNVGYINKEEVIALLDKHIEE
ncbi:MAG: thioredoxin [Clostridia bacterium]